MAVWNKVNFLWNLETIIFLLELSLLSFDINASCYIQSYLKLVVRQKTTLVFTIIHWCIVSLKLYLWRLISTSINLAVRYGYWKLIFLLLLLDLNANSLFDISWYLILIRGKFPFCGTETVSLFSTIVYRPSTSRHRSTTSLE